MAKLSAVILAAGNSERMGRTKALLEYRGATFLSTVCDALRQAGADERIVVLGRAQREILSAWKPQGEKVSLNPRPEDGQLSSLRSGIESASKDAAGFMVCLADQPTIKPDTYKKIIAFWREHKDAIVIPRCMRDKAKEQPQVPGDSPLTSCRSSLSTAHSPLPHKRGHPIIIPAIYRHLCFEGPLDKGLHWVTHHPSVKVLDLTVEDAGIIRDFDTPEQYEEIKGK